MYCIQVGAFLEYCLALKHGVCSQGKFSDKTCAFLGCARPDGTTRSQTKPADLVGLPAYRSFQNAVRRELARPYFPSMSIICAARFLPWGWAGVFSSFSIRRIAGWHLSIFQLSQLDCQPILQQVAVFLGNKRKAHTGAPGAIRVHNFPRRVNHGGATGK
jgi:hypothetical protein